MSLQVWLPLNGDLKNKGLDNITLFQNTGATINNNGKIGKCYSFDASDDWIQYSIDKAKYGNKPISLACWFKCDQNDAGGAILDLAADLCASYVYSNGEIYFRYWRCYSNSGTRAGDAYNTPNSYNAAQWHHIVWIFNANINQIYVDGELALEVDSSSKYTTYWTPLLSTSYNKFSIGKSAGDSNWIGGTVNDVRIYDHALSLKQIKEISKGLVLHYPLNQNVGLGLNLVKNGFGQLGTENWTSTSNISTTELPSGHSQFKRSFFNNTTNQYIPIIEGATYKLQLYIKANTGSTALMHPTFYPYDIDKKMIHPYNVKNWFDLNTLTTLTQTLNPGDTKIYVEDLSKWNTNSGHYYNYAAIFNYQDSTGHIYATGEYTQNTPRFGNSTSVKTNLDKTNNIITLLSAYSGPIVPAGTELCASTDGSNYYYPFGALRGSDYQNWTYITKNFIPGSDGSQLKVAKYIRYYTGWAHEYETGIRITNLSTLDSVIYDTSGYEHNGTASTGITCNIDTPRYDMSTHGIGTQDKIIAPGLPQSVQTVSFWAKRDNTRDCVFFADGSAKITFGILRNQGVTGISSQKLFSLTNWDNSKWNHIVVINNNGTRKQLWINGNQEEDGSETNYWTHTASQLWFFTRSNNNNYPLTGSISDFRAYVTELSQQDILQLYKTSTLADKNNNFYTYEYDQQGYNNELQYLYDLQKSSSYIGTFFQNSDGLHIDGMTWVYHDFIPINPTNKTFKYDITYSNSSGNKLYVGWERYDANKTSRSNNATIYVISGVTSTASYQRVRGTVDLSTDGVNPTAFIKLRILNKWTGSAEGTEGTAIIHSLSLKEWTSNQNFDIININKQGVAYETQILEKHKENVNANRSQELISNNFYEI